MLTKGSGHGDTSMKAEARGIELTKLFDESEINARVEELGLSKDWAVRIIRHVGNYGEVYERNIGVDSDLGIPRGLNELWNAGGILYAPPIR